MIKYPSFKSGSTIGITAPSSGVKEELHDVLKLACRRMEERGFNVICGETIWNPLPSAQKRANEFNKMMKNDNIQAIIPPWGGELLIEMLEYVEFKNLKEKWILGYSDISTLLFSVTIKTGIATAHGTNLVDLRGEFLDDTTARWEDVLSTKTGESVLQYSSNKYQKEWDFNNPSPCVYHLNENTYWKSIPSNNQVIKGRLLGGCIDTIRHLIGTPFGDVQGFRKKFPEYSLLWYFENCELNIADLRRTLVQMRLAGWFDNSSGIIFGRSSAESNMEEYNIEDVYKKLSHELEIPIIYNIDCGHVPPQITLINGAFAEIEVKNGKGQILQCLI